ncbi:unnamed protein product [Acanthoscelides obtectus]|uniref:Uncharacterized protein n=1 Tax=Acanthoscelides obtectus TaxID=200917 RepID=A0A9P0JXJ2_ACAOB|nr:unnamed protein product [Acanthoscelides obtectus]CAK1663712.1 hypothetical protein AOBTE_LOCUS23813 [Acanthoscelides obtectus]
MKFLSAFLGIVLLVHNVYGYCPCASKGFVKDCGLCESSDMCHNLDTASSGSFGVTADGTASGIPIVVRPQEVPKPLVALPLNLGIVPGPCTIKKAIVRPAIVPRPVCTHKEKAGSSLFTEGKFSGIEGFVNLASAIQGVGINEDNKIGTPADPVSISIALKKQQEIENCERAIEDRLSFGFRRVPKELPKREQVKQLIPEVNIHRLNGQIIEFVPPKPGKQCKHSTLEEEAIEDLLELEAEEQALAEAQESQRRGPYNNILLEEIGYRPASLRTGSFQDVVGEAVNQAVNALTGGVASTASNAVSGAVSDAVAGAVSNAFSGAVSDAFSGAVSDAFSGAVSNAFSGAISGGNIASGAAEVVDNIVNAVEGAEGLAVGNRKYLPGNVEFKTLPKVPDAIILPTTEIPDSCESDEINLDPFGTISSSKIPNSVQAGIQFNRQSYCHQCQSHNFLHKLL